MSKRQVRAGEWVLGGGGGTGDGGGGGGGNKGDTRLCIHFTYIRKHILS